MKSPRICSCGHRIAAGVRCPCEHKGEAERKARFDTKRPSARERGYDSRWQKARATYLERNPVCISCGARATLVDHKVPHRGDQALFWNRANWQPLCTSCHSGAKQRIEKSSPAVEARRHPFLRRPNCPVVMVCGPAGAGKTTYVRNHAGPNDIIIDLDVIRARIAGTPIHAFSPQHTAQALDERNRILASLAHQPADRVAWFIIAAPEQADRDTWQRKLNARVVMLDTPLEICVERIRNDPLRAGQHGRMIDLAKDWWARHAADPGVVANFAALQQIGGPHTKQYSQEMGFCSALQQRELGS